ncbi:hypothetical protein PIB30_113923, partial [Stylosanthes scabra]|nr:hypothetical protein [Stylosanthes scabra]
VEVALRFWHPSRLGRSRWLLEIASVKLGFHCSISWLPLGHNSFPGSSGAYGQWEVNATVRFDEVISEPHNSGLMGFQVRVSESEAVKGVSEHDVRVCASVY